MITIMDRETVRRTITRLACEALENNKGTENLAIVGIRTRGVIVAQRIHEEIAKMEKTILPFGILDIALQRDDLLSGTWKEHPALRRRDVHRADGPRRARRAERDGQTCQGAPSLPR